MNRLKIALVRPNYNSHLITPPLGIGYLSAYLKANGYNVKIIDGLNWGFSLERIVSECEGFDFVGITCLSAYFLEVIKLSRLLKSKNFQVIIGGPHASALPELTLKETQADYIVIGEGESSLLQLLERIRKNKPIEGIPGVLTRGSRGVTKSLPVEPLDLLPFPDWEQMDPRTYKKAPHGGLIKCFPVASVISSRGCPFECTFCASPFLCDRKIRFRGPQNVVNEIEYLIRKFKVREIHFEDDNLTLSRKHIEDICKLILKKKIKVHWATPNGMRVDTMDLEILKLMKRSGCYFIAFGIESGNQEILNCIKKRTDLGTIENAVRLAKKVGIITQGFFIFGLPGETKETIRQTINFAKKLPLDKAQFLILDVLPGSQLWDELINKNEALNWEYKSYQEATWVPEGLDRKALSQALGRAFRSFFFRPRQILFLLKYSKLNQMPFIVKRIIDFNMIPFLKHN